MKKTLLVFTLAAFALGSCTKKESTEVVTVTDTVYKEPADTTKPVDTSLTISGIRDIRTMVWDESALNITVNRNSGAEKKVTMNISGLPERTEAKFTSNSGYTTFNTILNVNTMFTAPGTYPLTISSETEDGKTMDYNVNLVVDTPTSKECKDMLIGSIINGLTTIDTTKDSVVYSGTSVLNNTLDGELYLYNMMLHYENSNFNTFRTFSTGAGNNFHVEMMFDCETGMMSIPEQEVQGRSVSGGRTEMFKISGTGMVDIENGTYYISYMTEYDDNGTAVVSYLTIKGNLQ